MRKLFGTSVLAIAAAVILAGMFIGCDKKEPTPKTVAVTGVSLSKTSLSLVEGGSETLTVTVLPDNASNKSVSWKSSDTGIATVDGSGKVTAVKAGTATITVTTADGGKTADCSVTVTEQAKIEIKGNTAKVPVSGGTAEFAIQYNTTYTIEIEQSAKDWLHFVETRAMQSGTLVFTVDANKGDARTGKATVKDNEGKLSPITLTFEQDPFIAVSSVQVTPETAEIEVGETLTLTATVLPEDATDKTITWSSDNTSVATVDEAGLVTGIAVGTATITATAGEKAAVCPVTVIKSAYETERAALEAFYRANNGDNWVNNDNWCTDRPLSEWFGVEVSPDGRHVTGLSFRINGVIGTIPKEIADLQKLEFLIIAGDDRRAASFTGYGPLPEEIGNLKELKMLILTWYPMSGSIPDCLFDLTKLEVLDITYPLWMDNQPIPKAIGNLKQLKELVLNYAVSGELTPEIGDLRELEYLRLDGNGFTGSIPDSFGNLFNLGYFSLANNQLSGSIPSSLHRIDQYWKIWPRIISGNNYTLQDLQDAKLPAPKSPVVTTLSGGQLDMEKFFSDHDYTVLYKADPEDRPTENFNKLNALSQSAKNLGIIAYFENDGETDATRSALDEMFKTALSQGGGNFESFIYYLRKDYSEVGGAPFYTEFGHPLYPEGNPSEVIVIGPEKTIVYSTILNTMSGNKFDDMISFLEKELGSPIQHYSSSDFSSDGAVKTLQTASLGNGIDLVITGDAFSDRLIKDGTFEKNAKDAADRFFSLEPLKSMRNRFNVYLINAVSKNEEYFTGCSTAFSGSFGAGSAVGGDNSKVMEYVKKAIPESKMDNMLALVLMNTERYGGTCYMLDAEDPSIFAGGSSIAWIPYNEANAASSAGTLVHELGGHGLGKLADEYYYVHMGMIPDDVVRDIKDQQQRNWYVNVDFTNDLSKVRWSRFAQDPRYSGEHIGVYTGAFNYYLGIWRPTDDSIMFHNYTTDGGFNAPSRAQIYTRIMKLSEGSSWEFDYETFVKWDQAHPTKQSVAPATRANYVEVDEADNEVHIPPVIVNKTWRQVIQR